MSSLSAGPSGLLGPSRVRPSGEPAPPGGARGRTWRLAAGGAVLALVAAGCGGDDGAPGGDGGAASAGGMTLEITAPGDGATVEVPFTVELSSSEELGPTESGAHHVHVFFDGDDTEYQVVEGGSVEITDPPAGVETSVTVTVGEGGTGGDGVLPGY